MERTLISWSLPNFLTIVFMAVLGWFLIGLAAQGVRKYSSNGQSNA